MALAISQSEAEAKEKERQRNLYLRFSSDNTNDVSATAANTSAQQNTSSSYAPIYTGIGPGNYAEEEDEVDQALSRYLDKKYWEQRRAEQEVASSTNLNNTSADFRATAPPPSELSFSSGPTVNEYAYNAQNNGAPSMQASASATPNGLAATNGYAFNVNQQMAALSLAPNDEVEQTSAFCTQLREQVSFLWIFMGNHPMFRLRLWIIVCEAT